MAEPTPIGETIGEKSDLVKNKPLEEQSFKGKLGGPRPNSGRPKGKMNRKTLEAMKVKAAFDQRVMAHVDRLFNAQMSLAVGEQVLMVKEVHGKGKDRKVKHVQVTDIETIKEYLDWYDGSGPDPSDGENYYYLTTKSANNMAIDSLINRALGKVPDKLEVTGGFFNRTEIVIKEAKGKHIDVDIGNDGQLIEPGAGETAAPGDGVQQPSDSSVQAPESPASS